MNKKNKKSSIIIRTHNHKELLRRLLKKIKEQRRVSKPEIIIIDSSSTDGTKELAIKEGCKIIQINPKDFTHAHTFNLGAKNSKHEIIIYVSVDVIPKNELWLYHLLKHFKDKKVAGVFSKQEPINNFNLVEEFKLKKIFKDDETLANFSNASGALRKIVWKKIKYDENIPYQHIGGEDQHLAIEAKRRGHKIIYEPKSIVYHSHKYPLKFLLRQAYQEGIHKEEIKKWNKDGLKLNYSKADLIRFLIKRKAWLIIIRTLIFGVLMRISSQAGEKRKYLNFFVYELKKGHYFYLTILFFTYPLKFVGLKNWRDRLKERVSLSTNIKEIHKIFGLIFLNKLIPYYSEALKEVFLERDYNFFEVNKKDIVYDVGACGGELAIYYAKKGSKVLAFELEKESFDLMNKNIKLNKFEKKIKTFLGGINDKNSIDFYVKKTKERPSLIKIDVEGDELKVLKGARKTLQKYSPRIIVETHSKELEKNCLNLLKIAGYTTKKKLEMGNEIFLYFLSKV